jgi:hypothetical protein
MYVTNMVDYQEAIKNIKRIAQRYGPVVCTAQS